MELSCIIRVCVTHSCVYECLCLRICTSFERQSLLCFKLHFFPAPMSSTLISQGTCTRTYICIPDLAYLYDAARRDLPPAYHSCRNISWLFYGVTFRLPPMNPVGERGASLHTPQNSKANHPCRSQQSVQLREKKTPGTSRHQQSRQADCLSSAVLLIPFALEWTHLLCLLKNIVFLSLIYSNRKQL